MHFAASAVLGFMPLLSLAMPNPFPQAGRNRGSNQCDTSSFNNGVEYEITQAPVADCLGLIDNVDRSGNFTVSHSWARPYTYGGCGFSVRVIAGRANGVIGGADVVDLTQDSFQFQESGYISCKGQYGQVVSAEGEVNCNALGGNQVRVEWILASSAYNPPN